MIAQQVRKHYFPQERAKRFANGAVIPNIKVDYDRGIGNLFRAMPFRIGDTLRNF